LTATTLDARTSQAKLTPQGKIIFDEHITHAAHRLAVPSATEIVCALGLEDALVGVTHECDYPAVSSANRN
jgi:ABC-type hemin transport system substrate-binding protein